MNAIADIVRTGGTINVPRGFLKRSAELLFGEDTVGRFAWDEAPPGRAFFDTSDARFEIDAVERSRLTRRRTIQVRRSGEVIAELHSTWRGGDGDAITSAGHRFAFSKVKGCYVLEREVGHGQLCTVTRKRMRGGRQLHLAPCELPTDEVVAVVVALLFHVLAIDYAADKRAMAAGGAAGGG